MSAFTETAGRAPSAVESTGVCSARTDTHSTTRSVQCISPTATATHTSVSTHVVTSTDPVAAASKRSLTTKAEAKRRHAGEIFV